MKKIVSKFSFTLITFAITFSVVAQHVSDKPYGGTYDVLINNVDCLSEEQRTKNLQSNHEVIKSFNLSFKKRGSKNEVQSSPGFGWPLKASSSLNNFSYYGIANFVDHDPSFPNQLLDYNGGTRSYDLESGYNHQGTDIFPWPFGWYIMDNDLIEIVAMADGIIIGKDDGNYDRNCDFSNDNWNAVYILHDDGIIAWYGHLKNGSTTTKAVGETVTAGEFLGIIGSSGSSTGPHLHLELYDADDNLIDPWFGPYNPSVSESWWTNQRPYYDSKINKVASHSNWPVFPDCPQQEILNLKDTFQQGDTVYLITYYQDQLKDQVSQYTITTPENLIWASWEHSMDVEHYSASYWGWWLPLPTNASLGQWEFAVFYNQQQYIHNFTVTNATGVETQTNFPQEFSLSQNYPNPFNPSTKINYTIPLLGGDAGGGLNAPTSRGDFAKVRLVIYDILGNELATLVKETKPPGRYEVEFDASFLPSGLYCYRLTAGAFSDVKKMVMLK